MMCCAIASVIATHSTDQFVASLESADGAADFVAQVLTEAAHACGMTIHAAWMKTYKGVARHAYDERKQKNAAFGSAYVDREIATEKLMHVWKLCTSTTFPDDVPHTTVYIREKALTDAGLDESCNAQGFELYVLGQGSCFVVDKRHRYVSTPLIAFESVMLWTNDVKNLEDKPKRKIMNGGTGNLTNEFELRPVVDGEQPRLRPWLLANGYYAA